ncbi:hypothetical protein [Kitasatospora cinereorecta]|uniref:Secreted protein n=1 Tax=Kitasatospora cinereorecta TaxID=285560 RepID=A0ABW0VJV0_9ACTN
MNRLITRTLTLLAVAGIAAVPTTASADAVPGGNHGTVVVGNGNQVAGYDLINAGHEATVGSQNGGSSGSAAAPATDAAEAPEAAGGNYGTVVVGNGNQVAGDDIINATNDATVGSYNGASGMAAMMTTALRPITG